jgi:hypothetical protein
MSATVLALADFAGMDEAAIKAKVAEDFEAPAALDDARVIVAYMHEGSWGCDSDAFIVFERGGKLYEAHGSHCSCYGFEGQWEPEEVPDVAAILKREDWALAGGGYDDDSEANAARIRAALAGVAA